MPTQIRAAASPVPIHTKCVSTHLPWDYYQQRGKATSDPCTDPLPNAGRSRIGPEVVRNICAGTPSNKRTRCKAWCNFWLFPPALNIMLLLVNGLVRGRQTSLQCFWILPYLHTDAGTRTYADYGFLWDFQPPMQWLREGKKIISLNSVTALCKTWLLLDLN